MNIEKSLEIVKGKLLMIKKLLKNDEENGHSSSYEMQKEDFEAIETLLTAYEKEKEKNKELEKIIQILEAKPYTAYTLYGDILHESDEIAQMLKEIIEED